MVCLHGHYEVIVKDVVALRCDVAHIQTFLEVGFKLTCFLILLHRRVGKTINEKLVAVALLDHLNELCGLRSAQDSFANGLLRSVITNEVRVGTLMHIFVHFIVVLVIGALVGELFLVVSVAFDTITPA